MNGGAQAPPQPADGGLLLFRPWARPPRIPALLDGLPCMVFPDETAKAAFLEECREQVQTRCLSGVRAGCAVRALQQCQGNKVLQRLGLQRAKSCEELEECQNAVMEACLRDGEQGCSKHAQSFCTEACRDDVEACRLRSTRR